MTTLRQLRAFAEVARRQGFTAAARHLHLTQSALSHMIREMERELGVRLLDRSTRGVALTPAGSEFLTSAERILAEMDEAVSGLRALAARRRGRVTVAAPPVLCASLVPEAIARFKRAFPEVSVRLMDVLTKEILEAVRSGEADLGVGTFRTQEAEIQLQTLYQDRLMAVVPAGSALARRRRLTWRDLRGQPLVMLSSGSAFHSIVERAASQGGEPASPAYEVGYMGTAIGLVEAGLGVAVLPAYARDMANRRRSAMRPVESPGVTREISLATRAGRSLTPAAAELAAALRGVLRPS